jgi:hypothetical protein
MKFEAQEYFLASTERMAQARRVHEQGGAYALAMYLSGLAVECMLPAFRWEKDKSFEGRHDLDDLLNASDFIRIDEQRSRTKRTRSEDQSESSSRVIAAMGVILLLWHNNLRFASEASLRAHLKRIHRLRGIKGDALKKNSSDLLDASQRIVDKGVGLWTCVKR